MNKNTFRSLIAASLAAASFTALAATQGTVGTASSQGSSLITLTVNSAIVVKSIDDIPFTVDGTTPIGDLVGRDTFCVGGLGYGDYRIEFESNTAGADSGFELANATQNLSYNVAFTTDTSGGATGVAPQADGFMASSFALDGTLTCDTDNAQLIVTIPSSEWESATETSYSDTLYITVTGQ